MLTTDQRDQIERRLQQEREEALEALRAFERDRVLTIEESTGELTTYRLHPADVGTETMEQEKQFLLASKEGERLNQMDDALGRLYADPESFGVCTRCGEPIEMDRLMMVPATQLCAADAREVEG